MPNGALAPLRSARNYSTIEVFWQTGRAAGSREGSLCYRASSPLHGTGEVDGLCASVDTCAFR